MKNKKSGKVYLVGAGPGDIGLLTIKGRECIEQADVIIYDYLANEKILSFARPDAKVIFMGKHGGGPIIPQKEINRVMVSEAKTGKTVARLKGGDPFIFGRGGEEAEVLANAGIAYEIVPGVTSGISVPAYAGIPLTHRDYSSSVLFITGHEDPSKEISSIAYDKIGTGVDTIVIYMGVTTLPSIVSNLLKNGRHPDTPSAVIQWGTTDIQKVITGTLRSIVKKTIAEGIRPPAIIVIGEVVKLRKRLMWFEKTTAEHKTIKYTSLKSDILKREIYIAATPRGICRISFEKKASFIKELKSVYKDHVIVRDNIYFTAIISELNNYFKGVHLNFTSKLDLTGTAFQKLVWKTLLRIPYGKTASYKDIAEMTGRPGASRAAGSACGENPVPIIIPCHRIISADSSLGGYSGGLEIKKALLGLEGIIE
ncbi:MAG: uroporphyrinogen-III C-methyltransferase [Nitrospirae bacterium]|nr:uroporphyrinogen-III C-methyltransferase [Nitrospirota bacterium]